MTSPRISPRKRSEKLLEVCCLAKQDIPEVESVIELLTPLLQRHWREVAEELGQTTAEAIESLSDEEDGISPATEDFVLALLGSLTAIAGRPLPRSTRRTVLAATGFLRTTASRTVGYRLPNIQGAPEAALNLIQTMMQGRVTSRLEAIRAEIRAATGRLGARTGIETRESLRPLRTLYDPVAGFVPVTVDTWAYQEHNFARIEAIAASGRTMLTIFNNPPGGPDGKTTAFCRWVHEEQISTDKALEKIREIRAAGAEGDVDALINAAPLSEGTDPREFAANFRARVLPPYHRQCRTVVQ